MEALPMIVIAVLGSALMLACTAALLKFARVTAQPDEWLLRVRNGKVLDAGIGIGLWRKPGDVIARFSSTLQRVRFTVEAPGAEHLPVKIDGFILWTVAPDVERVFRAFSKLGIANLDRPPPGLKSRAHLLTSSQHHAFQALLAAEVRAQASGLSLSELLLEPHKLLGGLERRLSALAEQLGIVIERIEVLQIEPADPQIGKELSARSEERLREEAEGARLEVAARLRKLQAEQALHQAAEQLELDLARRQREEAEWAAALERVRRTAENERDAALARNVIEEQKSAAVREHELARFVAEKTAEALASWQIREGKWIHLGNASPVASIGGALLGMREIIAETRETSTAANS
jgi:hypothetical protein